MAGAFQALLWASRAVVVAADVPPRRLQRQRAQGLDHFEGRSDPEWQHHVVLTAVACAYIQRERMRTQRGARLTFPAARAIGQEFFTALLFAAKPRCIYWMDQTKQKASNTDLTKVEFSVKGTACRVISGPESAVPERVLGRSFKFLRSSTFPTRNPRRRIQPPNPPSRACDGDSGITGSRTCSGTSARPGTRRCSVTNGHRVAASRTNS